MAKSVLGGKASTFQCAPREKPTCEHCGKEGSCMECQTRLNDRGGGRASSPSCLGLYHGLVDAYPAHSGGLMDTLYEKHGLGKYILGAISSWMMCCLYSALNAT